MYKSFLGMSRTNSANISSLKLAFWTLEKGAPFRNRTNNAEMFYTQRFPTINCLIRRNNLCITMVNHRPLSVCDDGPQWILWLWALYWILICIWNEKLPQLKEYLSCYHCLLLVSLFTHYSSHVILYFFFSVFFFIENEEIAYGYSVENFMEKARCTHTYFYCSVSDGK